MRLQMPQEVEVWYIIPAIRRELAKAMLNKGMSQREIAKKLGVTDAAISHYMKSKRASKVMFSNSVMGEVKKSAERIVQGASPVKETETICKLCRNDMTLCKVHKHLGYAPRNCKECWK